MEGREKARTEEAKARLTSQVDERVKGIGTGHMRTGRLWADALLRRQAEEATVHARRLRQSAQLAATSELGEKGDSLKAELGAMKHLMANVRAVLDGTE